MEGFPVVSSNLRDNNTMFSWKFFVEKAINNFKNDGYNFSHISQMNFIIVCNKRDMTYEHYLQQSKSMLEWKLNAMINRDKSLINKFPRNWMIL